MCLSDEESRQIFQFCYQLIKKIWTATPPNYNVPLPDGFHALLPWAQTPSSWHGCAEILVVPYSKKTPFHHYRYLHCMQTLASKCSVPRKNAISPRTDILHTSLKQKENRKYLENVNQQLLNFDFSLNTPAHVLVAHTTYLEASDHTRVVVNINNWCDLKIIPLDSSLCFISILCFM